MYNYQFDSIISNQAQQVIDTPAPQDSIIPAVITDLAPDKKEQIYNVGRDS